MNLTGSVFIRADAGVSIGIGHIRRCAILAGEIVSHGAQGILVTRRDPNAAITNPPWPYDICWLEPHSAFHVPADQCIDEEVSDAKQTLAIVERHSHSRSWVIVDNERFGSRWEAVVREAGYRVLAIDDYRTRKHCADIIVSDSQRPFDKALISSVTSCRQLCGSKYALIDSNFWPAPRMSAIPANRKKTVLISYGGSDPSNETYKGIGAVALLRRTPSAGSELGTVDIVVGPLNRNAQSIMAAAQEIQGAIVHRAPTSLAPLMSRADIVLTAGGNSLIEALVMHKPCIVTITGDNQEAIVNELSSEGMIVSLGKHVEVTAEVIANSISQTLRAYGQILKSVQGKARYDHHGARRIVREMSRYSPCFADSVMKSSNR